MELRTTPLGVMQAPITELSSEGRFIIMDVRTIQEFVGDHVQGAVNIPYDEIQIHINKIKSWNKPVITYSYDGRRSQMASTALSMLGVKAIDGGNMMKVKALMGQL